VKTDALDNRGDTMKNTKQTLAAVLLLVPVLSGLAACGGSSEGTGRVQVFVAAEDSIPDGLQPGTDEENIQDGWTVIYNKFLISIGNFRASRTAAPADKLSDARTFVLDMKNLPAGGLVIADFPGAKAVRWDKVGFDLPNAASASICAAGIAATDCAFMKNSNFSVYFEATLTKEGGQSCRPGTTDCVARSSQVIRWGLKAGTSFDDCAPPNSSDKGFAVPSGGTVQVKPTIHGDHWFFTNITQGEEITGRRAQWIVDADTNRDGETTIEELKNAQAATLFPSPPFNLSGGLASPECTSVSTAYCYLLAQARTLGDYQGDGECDTRRVLP